MYDGWQSSRQPTIQAEPKREKLCYAPTSAVNLALSTTLLRGTEGGY
jgi:hypothetical protein